MEQRVQKLLKSRSSLSGMMHYVVPEQNDLLKDEFIPEFPYNRTVEEARRDPLVVLHTSRSVHFPVSLGLSETKLLEQHNWNTKDDPIESRVCLSGAWDA